MPKELHRMKPRTLGREIRRRTDARLNTMGPIFDQAAHGDERFLEIVARLGAEHKLVRSYRAATEAEDNAIREAERRYGRDAVTFRWSDWPRFLETVRV